MTVKADSGSIMRALVVDDEPPARQRLIRLLEPIPGVEVVGEAGDGLSALSAVAELQPDLLLLDIQMPELGGLEVANALQGPKVPAVIFVTAFDDHALAAFDAAAVDYLVKPVAKARLVAAIDKARRSLGARPPARQLLQRAQPPTRPLRLAVRAGNRYAVFDPEEIAAVIATDHYATIVLARGDAAARELLSEDSLDAIGERLDGERFIRVHRSALINLAYLAALERQGDRKYVAVLSDPANTRAPVSRERLAELKRRLGI